MNAQQLADQYLIFKCVSGSVAYGMNTEDSDVDTRGVFVAPPDCALGFSNLIGEAENKQNDQVIYEVTKFVKLASACNPNIIELLFTGDENIITMKESFRFLRDHRHLFLSTKAKHTFSGYAYSQLKRIKGHHRWISQEGKITKEPPPLFQYCTFVDSDGLCSKPTWMHRSWFLVKTYGENIFRVYADESGQFHPGIVSEDGENLTSIDVDQTKLDKATFRGILIWDKVKFKEARQNWRDYWEWKRNRNPARAALEEQYGFDGKHASHLVRLMKMAKEILMTGEVIVKRPDADELLAIREGSMTYEEIIQWAEQMDQELEDLYKTSSLRERPDLKAINRLLVDLKVDYWRAYRLI